ncbi:MAG: DNA polymerase [Candidatus Pacearchaeota archaeon]
MSEIETSNLFAADSEEMRQQKIDRFLPDIRKYLAHQSFPNIPPDPSIFSQEQLAQRNGMEWLGQVCCNLVVPESHEIEAQQYQLEVFFNNLVASAGKMSSTFSEIYKKDYVESPVIAVDLETTGLDTRVVYDKNKKLDPKTKIVGICLATFHNIGYYLPVMHTGEDGIPNWDYAVIVAFLQKLTDTFLVLYHNAQYDKEVLSLNGVSPRGFPYYLDTMVLHYLQDVNEKTHKLKVVSEKLGRKMVEISDLFSEMGSKQKGFVQFNRLPATNASVYGCSDAMNTYFIFYNLSSTPAEDNIFIQQHVSIKIDHMLLDSLRVMYRTGFPVNIEYSLYACKDIVHRILNLENKIYEFVGRKINIASPQQISKLLFDEYKVPVLPGMERGKPKKNSPGGLYSTSADLLDALYEKYPQYPLLAYVVQYRQLEHALSTILAKFITNSYIDSVLPYARSQVQYATTVAPTGRLSSASNGGRDQIIVKETATGNITYNFDKGDWSSGVNTQAISKDEGKNKVLNCIKSLPVECGLNFEDPYGKEVEVSFVERVAQI